MADEQYRWLDRGTAERFLNGEPPEAADPTTRDQAERLAATLRALTAPPPPADAELPGEAAALAAFRTLREKGEGRAGTEPDSAHRAGTKTADVGPIRIGAARGDRSGTADGPRRLRPLRLGLAAALVAGMVGGAAVLAGAGVLPTPSDDARSDPAASVTATGTHPGRPLVTPPPEGGGATPEGAHSESAAGKDGVGAQGDGDSRTPGRTGSDAGEPAARSGRGSKQLASACRAWRDGERLNGERRRMLEHAAGGPSHVARYCENALSMEDAEDPDEAYDADDADDAGTTGSAPGGDTDEGSGKGDGGGNDTGRNDGKGAGGGEGKREGHGKGKREGHGPDNGNKGRQDQGNGPGNRS